ncbi:unnamed protein product [Pylaiella littoralis]
MRCCSLAPDVALLAQTSRFLEAPAFACYKVLCFLYFLAWCLLWPEVYGGMYLYLTYWMWYIGCLYFTASFATSAMNLKRRRRAVAAAATASGAARAPSNGGGGGGGGGGEGGRWRGVSSCGTPVGDYAAGSSSRELQTQVPPFERALVLFQLFTWNVSCVGSLVVCTIYWTALYDGTAFDTVDINAHSFFAFIMVVDTLLVATRFRLRDLWKSVVVALAYLAFNVSHYYTAAQGDKVIYYILDWGRDPWGAVAYTALVFFILIPLFGAFHYGIFRLRESMFHECRERAESSSSEVLHDYLLSAEDGDALPGSSSGSRGANQHGANGV